MNDSLLKTVKDVNFNDSRVFKTWNYKYFHEDVRLLTIEALATLISVKTSIYQKQAALLLLQALLRDKFYNFILEGESKDIYPFDRDDKRVRAWTKEILKRGKCEKCGSTNDLEAHHIIKWSDFPQGRVDIQNGLCLCHDCHTFEHRYDQSYYMMKAKTKRGGNNGKRRQLTTC